VYPLFIALLVQPFVTYSTTSTGAFERYHFPTFAASRVPNCHAHLGRRAAHRIASTGAASKLSLQHSPPRGAFPGLRHASFLRYRGIRQAQPYFALACGSVVPFWLRYRVSAAPTKSKAARMARRSRQRDRHSRPYGVLPHRLSAQGGRKGRSFSSERIGSLDVSRRRKAIRAGKTARFLVDSNAPLSIDPHVRHRKTFV